MINMKCCKTSQNKRPTRASKAGTRTTKKRSWKRRKKQEETDAELNELKQ
jgi:hypothetical protein